VALTASLGTLEASSVSLSEGQARTTWTCGVSQSGCTPGATADVTATWNGLTSSTRIRLSARLDGGAADGGVDAGRITDAGTGVDVSVGQVFVFGRVRGPSNALYGFRGLDGGLRLGWTQAPGTPVFFRGRVLYSRGSRAYVWSETPVRRDGGIGFLPDFPEASHPSATPLLPCEASAFYPVPGGDLWVRCSTTIEKGSERVDITEEDEVLGGGPSAVLLLRSGAMFVATAGGRTPVQGIPAAREFGANARGTSSGFDLIVENTSAGTCYRAAISLDGGYDEEEQDHVPLYERPDAGLRGLRCTKGRLAAAGDVAYFPVTLPTAGVFIVPTGASRDAGFLVPEATGYDLNRNPPLLTIDQTLEETFVVVPY
jgi:hypothetical protein